MQISLTLLPPKLLLTNLYIHRDLRIWIFDEHVPYSILFGKWKQSLNQNLHGSVAFVTGGKNKYITSSSRTWCKVPQYTRNDRA